MHYCHSSTSSYSILLMVVICLFVLFGCAPRLEDTKQINSLPAEVTAFEASIASSYRIENVQNKISATIASGCDLFGELESLLLQYGEQVSSQEVPQGFVVHAVHNNGDDICSYGIAPDKEKGYQSLVALYETALLERVTIEQGMATVELPVNWYGGDVYVLTMMINRIAENTVAIDIPPLMGEGYTVRYYSDAQTVAHEYLVAQQGVVINGVYYDDTDVIEVVEDLYQQRYVLPLS